MASSSATSPGAAGRPLTDFEQVLLGVIADEPRSGYGLKKMFSSSPASVYQPSPGALYPALRRLEERGLLHAERQVSSGRRALRLYQVTEAGRRCTWSGSGSRWSRRRWGRIWAST